MHSNVEGGIAEACANVSVARKQRVEGIGRTWVVDSSFADVSVVVVVAGRCRRDGAGWMGGRGSEVGTFFGVLIISELAAGLAPIGATEPTRRIITGNVIVMTVVLDTYRSRRKKP